MEASTNRTDLCDDIWLQVFVFLSLDDRQNIRLTCSRFYRLCDDGRFLNREVISLYSNINIDSAVEVLSKTSKIIRHVKLEKVRIDDSVLSLFRKHGFNLWSVYLEDCDFSRGAFRTIIENCSNIYSMTLNVTGFAFNSISSSFNIISADLVAVINNRLVCNNVTDLQLRLPIIDQFPQFHIFFSIFPNVRRLNLEIEQKDYEMDAEESIISDSAPYPGVTLSSICNSIVNLSDQLEKLGVQVLRSHFNIVPVFWGLFDTIPTTALERFKEISLNWCCNKHDPTVFDALSSLKNLTHFHLMIEYRYNQETLSRFLQLLLRNTQLRSLKIDASSLSSLSIDRELFQAFVASKLEKLVIEMCNPNNLALTFEPSSLGSVLLPNFHLQHLLINGVKSHIKLLFASYFRSIKHLEFTEVNSLVIKNIFHHQTQIHSLRLHDARRFVSSDVELPISREFREVPPLQRWLTKEKLIEGRLEYLTYLEISEYRYRLTYLMLSQFTFPKLKALSIRIESAQDVHAEHFWQLLRNFSQLKYVTLELPVTVAVTRWPSYLNGLTKLRHLQVDDPVGRVSRSDYLLLFEAVPSLRTVVHSKLNCMFQNTAYFMYDAVKNEVTSFSDQKMSAPFEFLELLETYSFNYCENYKCE